MYIRISILFISVTNYYLLHLYCYAALSSPIVSPTTTTTTPTISTIAITPPRRPSVAECKEELLHQLKTASPTVNSMLKNVESNRYVK